MVEIFESLKNASPFVIAVLAIIYVIDRYLKYKEASFKSDHESALTESINAVSVKVDRTNDSLAGHIKDSVIMNANLLSVMKGVEAQMTITGSDGKIMSLKDQHMVIEHQWAWCRDSCYKVLESSIRSNNIKANEKAVTRKVFSNLRIATTDAQESLNRLEGVSYNYGPLFTEVAPRLWSEIFKWAVPIYHKDHPGMTLEEALSDLNLRITELFARTLRAYFAETDQATDKYQRTVSGEFPAYSIAADDLSSYRPGSGGYTSLSKDSDPL